ncbi:MAG: discoidin domain-containing protein [Thermoleophilia bacterium]
MPPRRWRRIVMGATLAASAAYAALAAGGAAAAGNCSAGTSMNIVAHPDDDLLFLSPDVLRDVKAGACVRTVFLTAGDDGQNDVYWKGREVGIMAAYANMAGVASSWSTTDAGVGQGVTIRTLVGRPQVSLVFLRLPDGVNGDGSPLYGNQSLRLLDQGAIGQITSVDGARSFTSASLTSTLTGLMNRYQPELVRGQDHIGAEAGDHPDHFEAAQYTRRANAAYAAPHTLVSFMDNPILNHPADVSGTDLTGKTAAFNAYLHYDRMPCGITANCAGTQYEAWLARRYTVAFETTGLTNLAAGRPTAASSSLAGLTPGLAVDGNQSTRWESAASNGQWWRVDLGGWRNVSDVTIAWGAAYASGYRIETSLEGLFWSTAATVSGANGGVQQTSFSTRTARFVRVVGVTRGTGAGIAMSEAAVYGPTTASNVTPVAGAGPNLSVSPGSAVTLDGSGSIDPEGRALSYRWTQTAGPAVQLSGATAVKPTFTAPAAAATLTFQLVVSDGVSTSLASTAVVNVGPVNYALNKPVTASSIEVPGAGLAAANANDGVLTTRWSSGYAATEWWQVDLGSARTFDTVDVTWEDAFASGYSIQTSNDGTTFTTVADVTTAVPGLVHTTVPATTARYVRILCTQHGSPYSYSIREVSVSAGIVPPAPSVSADPVSLGFTAADTPGTTGGTVQQPDTPTEVFPAPGALPAHPDHPRAVSHRHRARAHRLHRVARAKVTHRHRAHR